MTGWRIGWLLVPDELLDPVDRLAGNFTICPPALSQLAAVAAFDAYAELDANVARYADNRALLLRRAARDRPRPARPGRRRLLRLCRRLALDRGLAGLCARLLAETGVAVAPGRRLRPGRRRPVHPDVLRRRRRARSPAAVDLHGELAGPARRTPESSDLLRASSSRVQPGAGSRASRGSKGERAMRAAIAPTSTSIVRVSPLWKSPPPMASTDGCSIRNIVRRPTRSPRRPPRISPTGWPAGIRWVPTPVPWRRHGSRARSGARRH